MNSPDWFNNNFDRWFEERPLDPTTDPNWAELQSSPAAALVQLMSTPRFEHSLSVSLASEFNRNSSAYDQAIDSLYLESHVGGPALHHNLDGQHTFAGAFKALRETFPNDSADELVLREAGHLLRDLTTPSGINPFLDPIEFSSAKEVLVESFELPASCANDLLNFNAVEIAAVVVASFGVIQCGNQEAVRRLGVQMGRLSTSGLFAGSPAMLLLAGLCLCQAFIRCEPADIVIGDAASGSLKSATFLMAANAPGPLFIVLGVALVAALGAHWVCKEIRRDAALELEKSFETLFPAYHGFYASMR